MSVETYINQICEKYLALWMNLGQDASTMPPPNKKEFIRGFLAVEGDTHPLVQQTLSKEMEIGYHS
jgi:hypothetical protein